MSPVTFPPAARSFQELFQMPKDQVDLSAPTGIDCEWSVTLLLQRIGTDSEVETDSNAIRALSRNERSVCDRNNRSLSTGHRRTHGRCHLAWVIGTLSAIRNQHVRQRLWKGGSVDGKGGRSFLGYGLICFVKGGGPSQHSEEADREASTASCGHTLGGGGFVHAPGWTPTLGNHPDYARSDVV
jgi:hypothetical protein